MKDSCDDDDGRRSATLRPGHTFHSLTLSHRDTQLVELIAGNWVRACV